MDSTFMKTKIRFMSWEEIPYKTFKLFAIYKLKFKFQRTQRNLHNLPTHQFLILLILSSSFPLCVFIYPL